MPAGSVTHRMFRLAAAGLLLAATTGCVRFGSKPPNQLLGISSQARLEPGVAQSGPPLSALFVEIPARPRPSTPSASPCAPMQCLCLCEEALWVDTPARQFQALLNETIVAKTGRLVLDPSQYPAQVGQVLHGELLEFGVDARPARAVVTFDASMLAADGKTVRRQRFSASRPLDGIDENSVRRRSAMRPMRSRPRWPTGSGSPNPNPPSQRPFALSLSKSRPFLEERTGLRQARPARIFGISIRRGFCSPAPSHPSTAPASPRSARAPRASMPRGPRRSASTGRAAHQPAPRSAD